MIPMELSAALELYRKAKAIGTTGLLIMGAEAMHEHAELAYSAAIVLGDALVEALETHEETGRLIGELTEALEARLNEHLLHDERCPGLCDIEGRPHHHEVRPYPEDEMRAAGIEPLFEIESNHVAVPMMGIKPPLDDIVLRARLEAVAEDDALTAGLQPWQQDLVTEALSAVRSGDPIVMDVHSRSTLGPSIAAGWAVASERPDIKLHYGSARWDGGEPPTSVEWRGTSADYFSNPEAVNHVLAQEISAFVRNQEEPDDMARHPSNYVETTANETDPEGGPS